jgi:outer membrane receptor protein involved in Fe transport
MQLNRIVVALFIINSNLLFVAGTANAAQVVTGRVYDAGTAEPVASARVHLRGTNQSAMSDAEGGFALKGVAAGTYTIEVEKPSFESTSQEIVVAEDAPVEPVDLLLIGKAAVEGVNIVQQARTETPVAGGTQIVRKELTRIPGTRGDALTSLQSLPGIANTGTFTPFSSGVIVRGSDPSDARILVDGFEIPLLYHFGAVQSILPTEMIEDILYAPGGFGAEHGRASSGTIEVRTRKGQPKLGGFAELSFINGAAFLQGPIGDSSNRATFALSMRRSVIDAVLPAVLPKNSGLDFSVLPRYYDWQGRADWQPSDRWNLSLFVFGTDDATRFALDRDDPSDPALSGNFGTSTRFGRAIASASYTGEKFSNRWGLSIDYTRFSFDMSSDRHLKLSNRGITIRNESKYVFGPRLTLRGGGEVMNQFVGLDQKMPRPQREGDPSIPNFTFDPIVERKLDVPLTSVGAWLTADTKIGSNMLLTTGLRYDGFVRNNAHVLQPRVELKMDLAGNTLRASGGLYTRPPHWEDEIVERNLGPERAWQAALGLERELRPGLMVQTTLFHTRRSDLIVFDAGSRAGVGSEDAYVNRGTGSTSGAEVMLSSRGPKHFAWVAYTLARSMRKDGPAAPERLFDFDQTHNLVLVGSRKFGKDDRWQIGGRFQFTTGKPYTPVIGSVFMPDANRYRPVFGGVNSSRVETMHQLDLRLDRIWQFKDWRLSGFIDVQNVYAHATVMDYRYNADYTEKKPIKTLPILPSFGIRAEF